MAENIIVQVRFEMEQVDRLFESYAELLANSKQGVPDLVEMTALRSVLQVTTNRSQVISSETADTLSGYLMFRHFYRHSYAFFLEWSRMRDLVIALGDVWAQTRQELLLFIETLTTD